MCEKLICSLALIAVVGMASTGWAGVSKPTPSEGAVIEDTWVNLSWLPGQDAASFDVYFGDDFDSVNEGTGETPRGTTTAPYFVVGFPGFPYPDGLVPGTTYYWRVDELKSDGVTLHKGTVWSFSVAARIATNPDPADGAGLLDPEAVILNWTPGFGAKLHTVYIGDDYDQVSNAAGGSPQGSTTFKPASLESEKVYYWRVDEFDGATTYEGDIWSFTTQGAVGNPQPANGASDVAMNATLSWTPADSVASHEIYLGTDAEAVRSADAGSPEYKGTKALGEESFDPGLLEPDAAYVWRVDEVDAQGNVLKGPLWSFATGDFLSVEDFESYTDDDAGGEAIWQSWIDGFGVDENGAQVGYLLPPYAEQTIVHGGSQSMPLLYDNTNGVAYSQAELTLSDLRDWTTKGVTTLTLSFRGKAANAPQPMYVSLNGGAPVYNEDADASQISIWTRWNIDLQTFADQGVDLTNVNTIAIGFGDKDNPQDGTGTVYFDDIRLAITPPPAGRSLLFYEDFEELTLGESPEESPGTEDVWTDTPPDGWTIDDSGVPGIGDPAVDGVTDWAGWAFTDKEWWTGAAGDQRRSEFTLGQGTVAVADPDEWDDSTHPDGYNVAADPYDTWMSTAPIDISGVEAGSVQLTFDSSWRPEYDDNYHQTANIT
ncbi:MAG: hypothetical protein P8Z79_19180, partial [Sedimentisphaerales bacterium]